MIIIFTLIIFNLISNWNIYLYTCTVGWFGLEVGYGSTDPEPGRCRRTDGKKWRCSREVVADQKYCERHINRGRHRSRKPVEGQSAPLSTTTNNNNNNNNHHPSGIPNINRGIAENKDGPLYQKGEAHKSKEDEFGLVCSDSLLNPLNQTSSILNFKTLNNNNKLQDETGKHPLRQFISSWPQGTHANLSMGLGLGLVPAVGGPLGEALGECQGVVKPMDTWEEGSSPTGILQMGAFGCLSNSSAGSSPRAGPCCGMFGPGLAGSSLPTV
ncbi:Growth-regulating factor 2 [Striga hermonthica]|uniref:Growth-regulating factor n=1 Tax=Striga hermonthica TaxID=68872 RepID=A0A9N7R1W6_STRHE|nr:Growth-regulating factor 2 [Striga hermonthica]